MFDIGDLFDVLNGKNPEWIGNYPRKEPERVGNYRLIDLGFDGKEHVTRLKDVTRRKALARYNAWRRELQEPHELENRPTGRYIRLTGEGVVLRFDWC